MASYSTIAASDALLEQISELKRTHEAIRDQGSFPVSASAVSHNLDAAQRLVTDIERLVCNMKALTQPLASSTKVQQAAICYDEKRRQLAEQVFGISELLEGILLSGLSVRDIIAAMQVSRVFRDCTTSSTKLQRLLCLLPEPKSPFRTAFDGHKSSGPASFRVCLHIESTRHQQDQAYPFLAPANSRLHAFFKDTLPQLGSSYRDMLICQPPVQKMAVTVSCCGFQYKGDGVNFEGNKLYITSEAEGITVGGLHDVTAKLQEVHRHCPLAANHRHKEDGTVQVDVNFQGEMTIGADDGVVVGYKETWDRASRAKQARKDEQARMVLRRNMVADYIEAKKAAFEAGEAIPTFEEYNQSNGIAQWTAKNAALGLGC